MKYLLPSFLLLPFTVRGTPVSSGLPAASAAPSADLTSPAGNFSIPGVINTGTTVNGTDASAVAEEWCPSNPHCVHKDDISIGFKPFAVSRTLYISERSRAVTYRRTGDRLFLRGQPFCLR